MKLESATIVDKPLRRELVINLTELSSICGPNLDGRIDRVCR